MNTKRSTRSYIFQCIFTFKILYTYIFCIKLLKFLIMKKFLNLWEHFFLLKFKNYQLIHITSAYYQFMEKSVRLCGVNYTILCTIKTFICFVSLLGTLNHHKSNIVNLTGLSKTLERYLIRKYDKQIHFNIYYCDTMELCVYCLANITSILCENFGHKQHNDTANVDTGWHQLTTDVIRYNRL